MYPLWNLGEQEYLYDAAFIMCCTEVIFFEERNGSELEFLNKIRGLGTE
jgi:hypothetical protein